MTISNATTPTLVTLKDSKTLPSILKNNLELKVNDLFHETKNSSTLLKSGHLQQTKNCLHSSVKNLQSESPDFFKDSGQCRGASEWFLALFLNAKKTFPKLPTKELLISIAKEFKEGAKLDAAIIQKYQHDSCHDELVRALGISIQQKDFLLSSSGIIEVESLEKFGGKLLKAVAELKDGSYILGFKGAEDLPGHATVIIKEDTDYYFFDPNIGLFGTSFKDEVNEKEVLWFFLIASEYAPISRLDEFFDKSLEELCSRVTSEQGIYLKESIIYLRSHDLWGQSWCLNAWEYNLLTTMFEKKFPADSSYEINQTIFNHLLYNPAMKAMELAKAKDFYFQMVVIPK